VSGNPLDKYRDTRTSAASSIQGCGWVEIQHNLCFVDDEGQTEPAAGARYQLQVPSGPLIQGVLDENGFVSHEGVGFGTVLLEIEPHIENDKQVILQTIKKTMDEFIAEERMESDAIKARLKDQSAAGVTWEHAKAGGKASGNFIMDSAEFFGNLVWDVGKEAVHLSQYLNPWAAPMAFERDVARLKQSKKELQAIANTDLTIFTLLMNDAETQQLFIQFSDDYLDAQHSLEITEGSFATATAVILSIVTAFAGSAIAAGNGAAKLTQLGEKLADPIKRLIEVLKHARAKKKLKHDGNQRIESVAEIKHSATLKDKHDNPENNAKKDSKSNKPTKEEIELAKSHGSTSKHIAARRKVATEYLESNEFTPKQVLEAIGSPNGLTKGGIDMTKPIEVISFPPPDTMTQYVQSHGNPGNWFDPLGNQSPDALGINGQTRQLKEFKMPHGDGLLSQASPFLDIWTVEGTSVQTSGGGYQVLVNDYIKKSISGI